MDRVQERERYERNNDEFKRRRNVCDGRSEKRFERDLGEADSEYYHTERQCHSREVIRARLNGRENGGRYVRFEEEQRERGYERYGGRIEECAANAYVALVARDRIHAERPADYVEAYVDYRDVNQHFGVVREKRFYDRNTHKSDVAHKRADSSYPICPVFFLVASGHDFEHEPRNQIRREMHYERPEKHYRHIRQQRRIIVLFHKSRYGKHRLRNVNKHRYKRRYRRFGQHFAFSEYKARDA